MKKYLINEMSTVPVTLKEGSGDSYVFEGLFADFNVNQNGRTYTVENYMKCVESLQEAIKSNSLLGEMDHPDRFDVSMQGVSHMITEIRLDESGDEPVVRGKIKLIETARGKDAIAIADSGAPLYISSRGSGSVGKNGKVTLDEIYTYDIVSQPGFKKARMDRIEEAKESDPSIVGLMESRNIILTPLHESTESKEVKKETINNKKEIHKMDHNARFDHLEAQLKAIQKNNNKNSDKAVEGLISFMETFTTNYNQFVDKIQEVLEGVQSDDKKIKAYLNEVGKVVNHNASIDESADKGKFEKLVQYAELIAKSVNEAEGRIVSLENHSKKATKHRDVIVEHVNKLTDYSDAIAEQTNKLADHNDTVVEHVNKLTDHSDAVVEHVNKLTRYSDTIAEHANKLADHNDLIVTHINENGSGAKARNKTQSVKSITEKTSSLISEAKARQASKNAAVLNEALNERQQAIFSKLTESQKSGFISKYGNDLGNMNTVQVTKALLEQQKTTRELADFLKFAPQSYRAIWEGLDAKTKGVVASMAAKRVISNEVDCRVFWESINLGSTSKAINEDALAQTKRLIPSSAGAATNNGVSLGYSTETIGSYLK